ncbi:MAG: shikimate kinase [Bacteroidales bacterium]|nr:shikimate kinase [Bacteroidales bacterium]
MLIFIIGYMGAGKTTLGKHLAERLNYRFYDMDEMFEISTGHSIGSFFEKFGEAAFRQKEREILYNHLDDRQTVIATGGGTACYADNMALMNQKGITVYVDTGFDTIMKRLAGKIHNRPMLKNIPHEQLPSFIRDHMNTRHEFYSKAAIKVDGEEVKLDELLRNFVPNKPSQLL